MAKTKEKPIIRSSTHSLKFANQGKRNEIASLLDEYKRLLEILVNDVWNNGVPGFDFDPRSNRLECPGLLPNAYLKTFSSPLTARMKQCVGKQACSMILSALKKRSRQLYMLRKLQRENKNTSRLQRLIDLRPLVKPTVGHVTAELDSRFIDIQSSPGEFNLFVMVRTKDGSEVKIPVKHTKVSRKWLEKGSLKNGVRLNTEAVTLIFDIPKPKPIKGQIVGCDPGSTDVCAFEDKQVTKPCKHGHTLGGIQDILARRKKGSRGFKRAQAHRTNYINWSLNQINFSGIEEVRLEKIFRLRFKNPTSRRMTHWTYTDINRKMTSLSEIEGFRLKEMSCPFRSQRCNPCAWVCKANRKGKTFKCVKCGHRDDADLNAASNISLDLPEVPIWVRWDKLNVAGFYWTFDGLTNSDHEPIVRDTQ
jgi:hypothetical protein